MCKNKLFLLIAGAVLSVAVLLALPLMNGFKSSLYSILASIQPIPPVVELTDGEGDANYDYFGGNVDIDGNYAIVGAPFDDNNGYANNGAAYIFYNNAGTWGLQRQLLGPAYDSAYFGWGVGIDGITGRAIIGAPFYNNNGSVFIHYKDNGGINQWGVQSSVPNNNGWGNNFGRDVDISGDYAIVSHSGYNMDTGQAYIIKKDHPLIGGWGIYRTLIGSGNNQNYFGLSVAIDGDKALVGEPGNGYPDNYGRVYCYNRDAGGIGNWGLLTTIYFGNYNNNLGWSVDVDGDYAIIGTKEVGNRFYVFHWVEGWWGFEIGISKEAYFFGKDVSIYDSKDGKAYAVIGDGNCYAYMYAKNGEGMWNEEFQVNSSCDNYYNPADDGLGISAGNVISGYPDKNEDGRAYITEYMDATCGNNVTESPLESCDDGGLCTGDNLTSCVSDDDCLIPGGVCTLRDGDGCSSTCLIEDCGDGILVPIEECDDGGLCTGDNITECTSDSDCKFNGTCTPRDSDGCSALCELELCGDGTIQSLEQCDDGNLIVGDDCSDVCEIEECGNGIIQFGETCDDGNTDPDDGCSATCQTVCGDGFQVLPEECDDDNTTSGDGCSSICEIEDGGWVETAVLPHGDGMFFGISVSIDGNYAVVGDRVGFSIYIFKKDGSEWGLIKSITDADLIGEVETVNIGSIDLAISGDYLVAADSSGNALVFYKDQGGEDNWGYQQALISSDGPFASELDFGYDVLAISGNYIVVGNPQIDDYTGAAYVFKREGAMWVEQAKLTASDAATYDQFGFSVSIDGEYVIIGAPFKTAGPIAWTKSLIPSAYAAGGSEGAAYVFKRDGDLWSEQAKLTPSDQASSDNFGWSVDIDGEYAVIGASYKYNMGYEGVGAAYVFKRDGIDWSQQAKLMADDWGAYDQFGFSVSIAGKRVFVSAPYKTEDPLSWIDLFISSAYAAAGGDGAIYMFERDGESWSQTGRIDGATGSGLGASISLDVLNALIGAPQASENMGTAYIYNFIISVCGDGIISGDETCDPPGEFCDESCQIIDTLPPNAIIGMTAAKSGLNINLNWPAPSDNSVGYIDRYEIRYLEGSAIDSEEAWNSASVIYNSIVPGEPGNSDSFSFLNTLADGTYYFAVKSTDDSGNVSDISNSPFITIPGLTDAYITTISPLTSTNGAFILTVTGGNFGTKGGNARLVGDNGGYVSIQSASGNETQMTFNVPAGLIPDNYSVQVTPRIAGAVISEPAEDKLVITQSDPAYPVVTNVIPSDGVEGDSIQVVGENFTGATQICFMPSGVVYGVPPPILTCAAATVENDNLITSEIPAGLGTVYYVLVQIGVNRNATSLQTLSVGPSIDISGELDYFIGIPAKADCSGLTGELQANVTFINSQTTYINETTRITDLRFVIPAGTTLKDGDGNQYTGELYPPRLVTEEEALNPDVYDQLADGALVFEIGNPDDPVYFDEDIVVTFQIYSDTAPGLVWYYNSETGKFEPAGNTGTKDGVDFIPGGVILSHVGDLYTVGILTDHLSPYVIGVAPTITDIAQSSGPVGTIVTINGTNFHTNAAVTIGGQPATSNYVDTEHLTATVPAGLAAGNQQVVVTNPDLLFGTGTFNVTVPPAPPTGGTTYTPPSGSGSGLGDGSSIYPTRESLLKTKVVTEPAEEETPVVTEEPPVRPAAPTVSHVVTLITSTFNDIVNHWAETYINRLYTENIVSGKTDTKFAPNDPISRAEVLKIALGTFNYDLPTRLTYNPFPDVDMNAWYAPYAQVAKEQGIIKGFPEGMRPNELVTRAEALKILLMASKLDLDSASTKNFTDTSPSSWYMYYVRYAYENGIVQGYADGTFRPSATITRAEIAKITVKIMDLVLE